MRNVFLEQNFDYSTSNIFKFPGGRIILKHHQCLGIKPDITGSDSVGIEFRFICLYVYTRPCSCIVGITGVSKKNIVGGADDKVQDDWVCISAQESY